MPVLALSQPSGRWHDEDKPMFRYGEMATYGGNDPQKDNRLVDYETSTLG